MRKATAIIALGMASVGALLSSSALATTLDVNGVFNFVDNRSANDANIEPGLFDTFGARATPAGCTTLTPECKAIAQSTQGKALQGTRNVTLNYNPLTTNPFHYINSIQPATLPTGQWNLTFTNGGDTANASTPNIVGASIIPFATAMSVSGSGAQPTFNWNLPSATIDSQQMKIRDLGTLVKQQLVGNGGIGGGGVADVIFTQSLNTSVTTFTADAATLGFSLDPTHRYSVELDLRQLRDPTGGTGEHNTLSESRSFFDFALTTGTIPNVYLPSVDVSNPLQPVYQFHDITAGTANPTFIDPLIAVGYDYQIGSGDPNFASVLLPTGIGDNKYQLWLWDGSQWVFNADLTGGVTHDFGTGGVDRFRILGIEISAMLDPNNGLAFDTGLTWVAPGTFSGTMTPITRDVAETPLPATLPLFASGLGGLGFLRWRRKRKMVRAAA